jgi:predicted alpha/beta-fold hydrolase
MIVDSTFHPFPGLANRHLQTVLPLWITPASSGEFEFQTLELPDGDFLDLAWCSRPAQNDTTPIVIIFHGLEGSVDSPYARRMLRTVQARGWHGVVMHFRGCSGRLNRLARTYHSGETADAGFFIQWLRSQYPGAPLMAVGYSLGGNMLLKLCGEQGVNVGLEAAVSVCAPLRLDVCADQMQRGLSRLYQRHLLKSLKRTVLAKFAQYDYQALVGLSRERVARLNSFWAFDDAFTAPVHGFEDARDYYQRCSAYTYINNIAVPTLVLQTRDDPFMTPAVIPDRAELPSGVELEVSARGGHVGFIGRGSVRPAFWLEPRIAAFLSRFV